MLEKPFEAIARLARKIQAVATRVALKAAKVSEAMDRKVVGIEARRDARAQARALRNLPRKPTVEFVREVGQGRMRISLYRVTNHRAGTVRKLYSLNRVHADGRRTRLSVGDMAELRSLRNTINQPLSLEPKARQAVERRPRTIERTESPKQSNVRTLQPRQAEDRPEQKRWYTLIYIEHFGPDGAAQGRVVRNFTDLEEAKEHQKRHPGLLIKERVAERPLRQGQQLPLKLTLDVTQRIEESRSQAQRQEGLKLVVNPPAQLQDRRQAQGR